MVITMSISGWLKSYLSIMLIYETAALLLVLGIFILMPLLKNVKITNKATKKFKKPKAVTLGIIIEFPIETAFYSVIVTPLKWSLVLLHGCMYGTEIYWSTRIMR